LNELVEYHDHNPDPYGDACMNSGIIEEGVVFRHVEPANGFQTYIGITSLLTAVAEVYGLTPNQVKDRLTREKKMVDNLRSDVEALTAERDAYREVVEGLKGVIEEHLDKLPERAE
jgi:hypothetical protein